ncbi:type II toxin-antitoxin system HigB family toxin [Arcicella aurantiaca]|uniref:type II toxin-antitoxin system HigB family toxin n=1 Tax=Arcicella aurantiaca TaxID=591202 RepID=UPI000D6D5AEB|nr:type II toxin-antitoxin system HigB family toxin [Arcicella aurantiaca]
MPPSLVGVHTVPLCDSKRTDSYDTPQEVISDFKGADYVGNERIVFNIAKNKYRLIVSFNYEFKACWIKFVGTHKEYDKIDAKTVENY